MTTSIAHYGSLKLLAPDSLVRTGPVDFAIWNHGGLLGRVQRTRFNLIRRLIGQRRFERLLEVGYGSGVFAPHLADHCRHYLGLDIHPHVGEVTGVLRGAGVSAELREGSVTQMPWPDASVDAIVGVSVMEFVDDHDAACAELARVLKPGGSVFVVTPGYSPLLDVSYRMLTGKRAEDDFQGRRQRIIPALERRLRVVEALNYPLRFATGLYMYRALHLTKP